LNTTIAWLHVSKRIATEELNAILQEAVNALKKVNTIDVLRAARYMFR
jgi:hypothetical protein